MIDHFIKQENCYISAVPLSGHMASCWQIWMIKSPFNYWNNKQVYWKEYLSSLETLLPSPVLHCSHSWLLSISCAVVPPPWQPIPAAWLQEKVQPVPAAIAVGHFWMGESHLAELPYVTVDWRDDGNIQKSTASTSSASTGQRIKPGVIGGTGEEGGCCTGALHTARRTRLLRGKHTQKSCRKYGPFRRSLQLSRQQLLIYDLD